MAKAKPDPVATFAELPFPRPLATPEQEATIRQFQAIDSHVEYLEGLLSNAKALRKYVGENEMIEAIPPEVRDTGLELSDGSEWTFEQKYQCSIENANKPAAFEFLKRIGQEGMLKRTITISFGKEADAQIQLFRELCADVLPQYEVSVRVGKVIDSLPAAIREILSYAGLSPTITMEESEDLPGATMRAWVLKQLKLGKPLPDAFTVYAPLVAKQFIPLPAAAEDDTAAS
jgi:hypothetical protein